LCVDARNDERSDFVCAAYEKMIGASHSDNFSVEPRSGRFNG
jgi:hypothetical protein